MKNVTLSILPLVFIILSCAPARSFEQKIAEEERMNEVAMACAQLQPGFTRAKAWELTGSPQLTILSRNPKGDTVEAWFFNHSKGFSFVSFENGILDSNETWDGPVLYVRDPNLKLFSTERDLLRKFSQIRLGMSRDEMTAVNPTRPYRRWTALEVEASLKRFFVNPPEELTGALPADISDMVDLISGEAWMWTAGRIGTIAILDQGRVSWLVQFEAPTGTQIREIQSRLGAQTQ